MTNQYRCKNESRRIMLRQKTMSDGQYFLNGIDYIEVGADQRTLDVYFIHNFKYSATDNAIEGLLNADNVLIVGEGTQSTLTVESVTVVANLLKIRLDRVGDYSTYILRLVQSSSQLLPPTGIDPQLATVEFSFWVDTVRELDCQQPSPSKEAKPSPPTINYLAKDYRSFRQLMLDRLALTNPQWRERNPADIGIMLVELLAYSADYLSYYQDAVATEAYLGTARRRISVRRHARILDYLMDEGCNARAWVVIQFKKADELEKESNNSHEREQIHNIEIEGLTLLGPDRQRNRPGVQFFSKTSFENPVLDEEQFTLALNQKAQVFETLHDITLYPFFDEICFYTWGDPFYVLKQGATEATLCDDHPQLYFYLKPGRVLIIEEVKGTESGKEQDASIEKRHAVRLTEVRRSIDPLIVDEKGNARFILEIAWDLEDALPFDVKISGINSDGQPIGNISVLRGNVVLVDSGRSVPKDTKEDLRNNLNWNDVLPLPLLKESPLTHQGYSQNRYAQSVVFDPEGSATSAMIWNLQDVQPAITLWEEKLPSDKDNGGPCWEVQTDLLNSDRFARDFVVEIEEDRSTYLRFGDGSLGKKPQSDLPLYASYRIGNGSQGNVGANSIINIWLEERNLLPGSELSKAQSMIKKIYNPLPARGGRDPQSIEEVKLYAPHAFKEQKRAVTVDDYAAIAETYPGVQKALATRRWTGSWHTIFITVDRLNGQRIDETFKVGLLKFLESSRLAGDKIEIEDPRFVPLDIAMTVTVQKDYFKGTIKKVLLDVFSNRVSNNGIVGFFAPDKLTFGGEIYLSQLVAAAVSIDGVESVYVTKFQRLGELSNQALEEGVIRFNRLEIAQVENLPSAPQNGKIQFDLEEGR